MTRASRFQGERRRRRRSEVSARVIQQAAKAGGACALLIACVWLSLGWGRVLTDAVAVYLDPQRVALRQVLSQSANREVAAAYALRRYRLIWLNNGNPRPEALSLVQTLNESAADDLDPERYTPQTLSRRLQEAGRDSWSQRAATDVLLTNAYAQYVADLHTPTPSIQIAYTDPVLQKPTRPSISKVLDPLATSNKTSEVIGAEVRMNPLYQTYRTALVQGGSTEDRDTRRLMLANLERLRALPVNLGRRFVLVDAAQARLWMFENGRPVDTMKVVVGKATEATPMLAGIIRYAMFNPYWNVPPDLVQKVYAPRISAHPSTLAALRMEPWTAYTSSGRRLNPAAINWKQVAAGVGGVGLRQRPGPTNSMGAVKFMLPNELGIYLHDSPEKALFSQPRRTFSAGCVRVEDYRRFARWLYLGEDVGPKGDAADQRIDLRRPVPVYISYLTAYPATGHILKTADVYNRDQDLLRHVRINPSLAVSGARTLRGSQPSV